jgi:hypothetical protein
MQTDTLLYPVSRNDYSGFLVDLDEGIIAAHLVHYASRLLGNGLYNEMELEHALHKAVVACKAAGLPVMQNFKTIFVCSGSGISMDWLVSDLGLQLILLNADVSNPLVAKLQVQVLSGLHGEPW